MQKDPKEQEVKKGRGKKGEKGSIGPKGFKGEVGEKGARGKSIRGRRGKKGEQGEQGVKGSQGDKGEKGSEGRRGRMGLKGVKGVDGEKGENGEKGATGKTGKRGRTGKTGRRGQKGDKGYVDVSLYRETRYVKEIEASQINRRRNPFFLVPKSIIEPTQFTFGESTERSPLNLFSSLYLSYPELSAPSQKFNFYSQNENVFSSKCQDNEVLVGGDCQWDLFGFNSSPSNCLASDFVVNCDANTQKSCISSVSSSEALFNNKMQQVLSSIEMIDSTGAKKTIESPKCKMVQTRGLTAQERMGCGYFCFFHELDKVYDNEKSFACRYIPPSPKMLNKVSVVSQENSVWESTIKVITVETYCQSEDKQIEKDEMEQVKNTEREYIAEKEISDLKRELDDEKKKEQLLEDKLESFINQFKKN